MSAAIETAPVAAATVATPDQPATCLTQEQIDTFWQNGFLRIGSVLKPEEIETLRTEYDRVFAAAEASGGARNLSVGTKGDTKGEPPRQRMLQICNLYQRSLQFTKLIYDTRILDLVQDLIGPNIMLFHDQALNKPPRTGGPMSTSPTEPCN